VLRRNTLADRVWQGGGDEHGVTTFHLQRMHRCEQRVDVLVIYPARELVGADVPLEPQVHDSWFEEHPGLGFRA
jgi:hypothetical protein